jgi:hypothetical protein
LRKLSVAIQTLGGSINRQLSVFLTGFAFAGVSMAATIFLPTSPLTVTSDGTLASFTYTGTLTQNDTISFTASGTPCLQPVRLIAPTQQAF